MSPFEVVYDPRVVRDDIPRLDRDAARRIRRAIESRLTNAPHDYGKPLRHSLKGLWRLRVGDYRIVYAIREHEVWILRIGHRREVYDED